VLGDITSIACVGERPAAVAAFAVREAGVLAEQRSQPRRTQVDRQRRGQVGGARRRVGRQGHELARVTGSLRASSSAERVALKLLDPLLGCRIVDAQVRPRYAGPSGASSTPAKTVPGLPPPLPQRAAVRAGGGFNHRDSAVRRRPHQDNHSPCSASLARSSGPGPLAGPRDRSRVRSLDQVVEARNVGVDRVLLDNMTPEQVAEAVRLVEASSRSRCRAHHARNDGVYAGTGCDTSRSAAHALRRSRSTSAWTFSKRMLLAIDARNTQTVVGLFSGPELVDTGGSRRSPIAPPTSSR